MLFLSPFPSLAISTKPSSLSLVLSLCLNTLQSTHLGGCYWSSCILLPGNPFPLSQSVAVIAEGIRGGGVGGCKEGGRGWMERERINEESGRRQKVYNIRAGSPERTGKYELGERRLQ